MNEQTQDSLAYRDIYTYTDEYTKRRQYFEKAGLLAGDRNNIMGCAHQLA